MVAGDILISLRSPAGNCGRPWRGLAVPVVPHCGGPDPAGSSGRKSCPGAGTRRSLPVLPGPPRRHRAAGGLVSGPHARVRPLHRTAGPEDFPALVARSLAFNRSGSPITARGCRTGSLALRTMSISAARPTEFVGPMWPIGTSSRRGIRRCPTPAGGAGRPARRRPRHRGGAGSVRFSHRKRDGRPLELLHVEGRYAVYRVNPSAMVQHHR